MIVEDLTPEKKLFSGEAKGVQCPGVTGLFEVLDNHAPMIAALGNGKVLIKTNEGVKTIRISSGFMECLKNKVVVLVEG